MNFIFWNCFLAFNFQKSYLCISCFLIAPLLILIAHLYSKVELLFYPICPRKWPLNLSHIFKEWCKKASPQCHFCDHFSLDSKYCRTHPSVLFLCLTPMHCTRRCTWMQEFQECNEFNEVSHLTFYATFFLRCSLVLIF